MGENMAVSSVQVDFFSMLLCYRSAENAAAKAGKLSQKVLHGGIVLERGSDNHAPAKAAVSGFWILIILDSGSRVQFFNSRSGPEQVALAGKFIYSRMKPLKMIPGLSA